MTCDVVALLSERPEGPGVREIITTAMEQPSDVREIAGTIRIHDQAGRLIVSIEPPLLVPIAGEVERLLGPEMAGVTLPVWWVDVRSAADVPGARTLARRVADGLARRAGGRVWPPEVPDTAYAGLSEGGRS